MLPYVKGDKVIVPDRKTASTLMNKGNYGKPLKGGGLELSLLEAAYLSASDRLEVKRSRKGRKTSHHDLLLLGISSKERFMEEYLVFRDIRNRGINIQGGGERTFLAYPRGQGPGSGKADSWIMVFRDHDPVSPLHLHSEAIKRSGMRMNLLAAVVDGDWDLTYYRMIPVLREDPFDEIANHPSTGDEDLMSIPGGGALSWSADVMDKARDTGLGSEIDGTIALSAEEVSHMVSRDHLPSMKESVYEDLMKRGYLVKTGFKYGSHFRVYTSGSIGEHSDLLVHCIEEKTTNTWEQLARAIRLSHSVRKRMLHAIWCPEKEIRYLEIEWTRP